MFTFALILSASLVAQPDSDDILLHVIAAKECVKHPDKPGAAGELGIYQICPKTWAQFSKQPHSCAYTDAAENERVARALLVWLKAGLQRVGVAPTPFALAEAWNAGLSATQRGKIGAATRDYAQCVVNLMEQ